MDTEKKIIELGLVCGCFTSKAAARYAGISESFSRRTLIQMDAKNEMFVVGKKGKQKVYAPTTKTLMVEGLSFQKADFKNHVKFDTDILVSMFPETEFFYSDEEVTEALAALKIQPSFYHFPRQFIVGFDHAENRVRLIVKEGTYRRDLNTQGAVVKAFCASKPAQVFLFFSSPVSAIKGRKTLVDFIEEMDAIETDYTAIFEYATRVGGDFGTRMMSQAYRVKKGVQESLCRQDKNIVILASKGGKIEQVFPRGEE